MRNVVVVAVHLSTTAWAINTSTRPQMTLHNRTKVAPCTRAAGLRLHAMAEEFAEQTTENCDEPRSLLLDRLRTTAELAQGLAQGR